MRLGFQRNDLNSSPGESLHGSFRKAGSAASICTASSSSSKFVPSSKRVYRVLKDYTTQLSDLHLFNQSIEDWVLQNTRTTTDSGEPGFESPFLDDELHTLDFALEGVLFQQLFRMPTLPYTYDNIKEDEYLALEDFLYTVANGLWRTLWHKSKTLPFFVSCPRHPGSRFYTIEKAISKGRLAGLCGAALMSKARGTLHVHWDDTVQFVMFKQDITAGNGFQFSSNAICEALFYGVHILLSRSLSKYNAVESDCVFILVLDTKFGGVVKLGGDIGRLEVDASNPYESMAEWIKNHADVRVSPVDRIWNRLGNVNWGDFGTLQLILATFYSIAQWSGPPRKSITSLAADHCLRLQKRRMECQVFENDRALIPLQHSSHHYGEIVELAQHADRNHNHQKRRLVLKQGDIVSLEDQQQKQMSFRVQESMVGGNCFCYTGVALECPTELLTLQVGAHPSQLEPSWEDMSLWYEVQRQTKVLNIFKEQGISSRYLPELIASGRILHSGSCEKQSPKGRCDHPWCGTPMLVTYPVGEPLSSVVSRNGPFSSEEATRCCRDCLAALRTAKTINIQHGDICPENIMRIVDNQGAGSNSFYVLISWGRAVMEDRDSPAMNLQFSSAYALQHGKLCPSSDAESLVYLIYFVCGGTMQQQDSIESALQWKQKCWARRIILQFLGEVSPLLKAFADYIDTLCGTPYPVDYDIWLKRMNRAIDNSADRGKTIEEVLRLKDAADSPGTSGGGSSLSR